jgi:hypothetical protein
MTILHYNDEKNTRLFIVYTRITCNLAEHFPGGAGGISISS